MYCELCNESGTEDNPLSPIGKNNMLVHGSCLAAAKLLPHGNTKQGKRTNSKAEREEKLGKPETLTIQEAAHMLNVHGNTGGPLPVLAFGKFFLTEPISNPPAPDAGTIFAELIGLAEPGSNGNEVSHDIVQLYR